MDEVLIGQIVIIGLVVIIASLCVALYLSRKRYLKQLKAHLAYIEVENATHAAKDEAFGRVIAERDDLLAFKKEHESLGLHRDAKGVLRSDKKQQPAT